MTASTLAPTGCADVIDLERYPIHDLASTSGRELVARCRGDLADHGAAVLHGFVTPAAVAAMVTVAGELAESAWGMEQTHTVYFEPNDAEVDAAHPRARQIRSAKHGIAYDLMHADAPMRLAYEDDTLTRFIAAVLGEEALFRSADPLDAFQVTTMAAGEELGWHFDRSEFSVTVMYQMPEAGGVFQYHPGLRSADDENLDGVRAALDADGADARVLANEPGTLAIFRGRHALHRVTPVEGALPRINSVLTYGTVPDMRLNDLTSQLFYGRTSPR